MIQSGGSFLPERLRNFLYVAGEECMNLNAKHFQLMLPTAGNGTAEQNRHSRRKQLLAFVADRRVPEFPGVHGAVGLSGIKQYERFGGFEKRRNPVSAKRNGNFHDRVSWYGSTS